MFSIGIRVVPHIFLSDGKINLGKDIESRKRGIYDIFKQIPHR